MSQNALAPATPEVVFPAAYARLMQVFGVRTQVQLAECLDVRQSSISDAKRRNAIPDGWLMSVLLQKWVSPLWILTGEGAQYLTPFDGSPVIMSLAQGDALSAEALTTEQLMGELLRRFPGCGIHVLAAQEVRP